MHAIVLVGGRGTRLQPLTLRTPKQLLPVGGRPMIELVIERLASCGIDDVTLSLGYRPDDFLAMYPLGVCAGVPLHYAVEPEPLDTAGAIAFAARHRGIEETFVAVNGDVLTELDLGRLLSFHAGRGAAATVALTAVDDPSRYGVVVTEPGGRVVDFIEKPPAGTAPSNHINAGTYVLEPDVVTQIPAFRPVSIERETFPLLAASGRLFGQVSDADWIDVGVPSTYLDANLRRAAGAIGSGCRVHPSSVLTRSTLGNGVTIDEGAWIVSSVLLDGAHVARGAYVHSSIIGPEAYVGEAARVTDLAVLGHRSSVEPGALAAGVRISAPDPAPGISTELAVGKR